MSIVLAFVHFAILFSLAFWLWKRETTSLRTYFWPALIAKILAGITLGLVYHYYYTEGDTFQYIEDGARLAALAHNDFCTYFHFLWGGDISYTVWSSIGLSEPRALFLVKIVSVFCLVTQNNYWITSIYFSFISFYGAWLLVKQITLLSPVSKFTAVTAFLFFPSVIFWSSGLVKESLAMACLFFLTTLFIKIWQRDKIKFTVWWIAVLALWLAWNLKYYYLAVFLPVAATSLVLRFFILPFIKTQRLIWKVTAWFFVFSIPLVAISFVHPNFYPERFLEVIVENYQAYVRLSDPHEYIQYSNLQPTVLSMFENAPWALFSGLFRPFVWEAHTLFQLGVAIENLVILLLTIGALLRWRMALQSPHRLLIFSVLCYTFLLCIFLALSTPNFGTLIRYKAGFLPFFILIITVDNPFVQRLFSFFERSISNLVR